MMIKNLFEPFRKIDNKLLIYILIGQILLILGILEMSHSSMIPSPIEVISNFISLLSSSQFYDNLFKSLSLMTFGMGLAMMVALFLSYLSQIPFFRKLVEIICSFRYLTLTGLTLVF